MGFFDDSYNSAKSFLDTTVKKVDKTVDTGKLKIQIIKIEEEIHNDLFYLGQTYYKSVKNGENNDAQLKRLIAAIDEKKTLVEEKRKEIEKARNAVICYCGAGNLADAQYCHACGRKL